MEYEFDIDGYVTALLSPITAYKFCENAIWQRLYDEMAQRDKSWWPMTLKGDLAARQAWHHAHGQRVLAVYERLVGKQVFLIRSPMPD